MSTRWSRCVIALVYGKMSTLWCRLSKMYVGCDEYAMVKVFLGSSVLDSFIVCNIQRFHTLRTPPYILQFTSCTIHPRTPIYPHICILTLGLHA
jgi:hypothetical protein